MEAFRNVSGLFDYFWKATYERKNICGPVWKKEIGPNQLFFYCCMDEELSFISEQEMEPLMSQAFVTTVM